MFIKRVNLFLFRINHRQKKEFFQPTEANMVLSKLIVHMTCGRMKEYLYIRQQKRGIPVVTLRDRTTLGHCNPYKYKSGPSPLLSSTEEAALVAQVKDIAACGYGYTRRELAELAGETAFFLNKRHKCPITR